MECEYAVLGSLLFDTYTQNILISHFNLIKTSPVQEMVAFKIIEKHIKTCVPRKETHDNNVSCEI